MIHDLAHPAEVLGVIATSLHDGGTFLMSEVAASGNLEQDSEHPLAPTLYAFSLFHCMTVSLAQGGAGLGAMWGEAAAREMLSEAGFEAITVEHVDGDIVNAYYICRAALRADG